MWVGWIMGIAIVTPETASLYSVSVLFLLQISEFFQWFLRQMMVFESVIISVERTFVVANLEPEK